MFASGPGELAGVSLWRNGRQIWPLGDQEFVSWDGGPVESEDEYELNDLPYAVFIVAVNYDSLNPHTVTVALTITPPPPEEEANLTRRLKRFFGL